MWTDKQFWRDATWRSFRTFCQSLAGLLTVQQVSENMNAPWLTLIYASAIASLISLLQSIDRERAVVNTTGPAEPVYAEPETDLREEPEPEPTPTLAAIRKMASPLGFLPQQPNYGCGESLR